MKRIIKLLKNDWERVLFWLFSILFALVLLAWGINLGREKASSAISRSVPLQTSLLNRETAFAFQDDLKADSMNIADPFAFNGRLPVPRPPRVNTVATVSPTPVVPIVVRPKPPPVETPKPPPASSPPPADKEISYKYLGCMTTASGQKVALIKNTGTDKTGFLIIGEKIDGLEIKAFTDQSVTVKNANGNEAVIEYGKQISADF